MKPNPIVGQGTPLHRWQDSPLMADLPINLGAWLSPGK